MKKRPGSVRTLPILLLILLLLFTAASWFWNRYVFTAACAVSVAASAATAVYLIGFKRNMFRYFDRIGSQMSVAKRERLSAFPIAVTALSENGRVIWYNDLFREQVLKGRDCYGADLSRLMGGAHAQSLVDHPTEIRHGGRAYTVYGGVSTEASDTMYLLYFIDDTELKNIANEYKLSRPSVGICVIDNLDELIQNAKESERAQLSVRIETILEQWLTKTTGFMRKIGTGRFLFLMEERHMAEMIAGRFAVLDEVRMVTSGGRMSATLSIGVGRGGETLHRCEEMARQALDMALGRGGDQAAVCSPNGYEFFGGVSKGVEKRTRVRSRIIANALKELIEANDNVLIMGHCSSDLDSLGAAVGVWRAAQSLGKPAHIVIDQKRSLAQSLIQRLKENDLGYIMLDPEEAMQLVGRRTVLVVVDTHRPDFLESPELYRACKQVVVIDHHRKMVEHIDNAVIFFHEPYASSTSEMVAELLQYIDEQAVGQLEAEALLSGVMLDTKNFILRTGVRTFEAAAFLRRKGADTVEVKKMFSSSMAAYQEKAKLVAEAKLHGRCAVTCSRDSFPNMRICSAQAADELLSIDGVDASFVLYKEGDTVYISARSMGAVNVQLIMEAVGGGGHLTMAGAQLKGSSLNDAQSRLIEAADRYFEERGEKNERKTS
ncbi:MAG: hypothetical protein HFE85_05255 [Clostridiales bacterium]|nr:hypothetical protein [Clostridiales bacterium]